MANQPKTLIESDEFRGRRIWIDEGSQQRLVEISAKHELAQSEGNAVECRNLYAAFHQLLALSAKLGRKDSKVFRTSIVLPESLIFRMRTFYPMFSFSQWCGTALADAADELDRLNLPPEAQPKPDVQTTLERTVAGVLGFDLPGWEVDDRVEDELKGESE